LVTAVLGDSRHCACDLFILNLLALMSAAPRGTAQLHGQGGHDENHNFTLSDQWCSPRATESSTRKKFVGDTPTFDASCEWQYYTSTSCRPSRSRLSRPAFFCRLIRAWPCGSGAIGAWPNQDYVRSRLRDDGCDSLGEFSPEKYLRASRLALISSPFEIS
jgi:hypothetical protein